MARTFRRRGCWNEHPWPLQDWRVMFGKVTISTPIDSHNREGRRLLARFHSDAATTLGQTAPRRYRKPIDRHIQMRNRLELHRWLRNPSFDPVFRDWHKHEANWSWW